METVLKADHNSDRGTERSVTGLEEKRGGDETSPIDEGIRSTKALIHTFLQTVKGYRLYEANHPIVLKFMDRLKNDFKRYFEEYDSFALQIAESHLIYRGRVVYEGLDPKESLSFIFFKDGVREIRFYKGLETQEIVDFLNIVRQSDRVNRMKDDFVTLFWEKDFSHIAVTTVDDFLEWGGEVVPATEEDLQKGAIYEPFQEEEFSETGDGVEPQKRHPEMAEGLREALNVAPGESLVEACQLTPDEMKEINREIEGEQNRNAVRNLADSLIEILVHLGEDREAHENMIAYFERTLESLLERKNVGEAATLLRSLKATEESMALEDRQRSAIHRIIETTSGPHFIELLGKNMRGNGEANTEPVLDYLRMLTKQVVDPLCHLLVELEPGRWKKLVSDFLAELSRDDIQPLIKFLSDGNPILVCHILYILGKVNHPSTMTYLQELAGHEDPRVREVTLQVLTQCGDQGTGVMQKFLKDDRTEIRSRAALLFARFAKGQAVEPLAQIVLSDGFQKRGFEEKASFLRALGETASPEAIPVLKKVAKKRFWFRGVRRNEMRLCAAHTLKMMEAEKRVMS